MGSTPETLFTVLSTRRPRRVVENSQGETVVVDDLSPLGSVFVTGCEASTIDVRGKSCSVVIERCSDVTVRLAVVAGSVSIIKSDGLKLHTRRCRCVMVDASDGVTITSDCQPEEETTDTDSSEAAAAAAAPPPAGPPALTAPAAAAVVAAAGEDDDEEEEEGEAGDSFAPPASHAVASEAMELQLFTSGSRRVSVKAPGLLPYRVPTDTVPGPASQAPRFLTRVDPSKRTPTFGTQHCDLYGMPLPRR